MSTSHEYSCGKAWIHFSFNYEWNSRVDLTNLSWLATNIGDGASNFSKGKQ